MAMGRFDIVNQIQQLDPERDNMKIMYLSFGYEFSWDSIRSLEIALYRTYCAPRISAFSIEQVNSVNEHSDATTIRRS